MYCSFTYMSTGSHKKNQIDVQRTDTDNSSIIISDIELCILTKTFSCS